MKTKSSKIKVNLYSILEEAIERGTRYGYHRAFKHTDNPTEDQIIDDVLQNIMTEVCGVIDFDK